MGFEQKLNFTIHKPSINLTSSSKILKGFSNNSELKIERSKQQNNFRYKKPHDEDFDNGSFSGEKKIYRLIAMDNNCGFADKYSVFQRFLFVTWKFKYIFLYVFHILYLVKVSWQVMLYQTKIFNILLSAVDSKIVLIILTNNCGRETTAYISKLKIWLNRIFTKFKPWQKENLCYSQL